MADEPSALSTSAPPKARVDRKDRVKILLVDDQADQLLVLETILSELDQDLVRAASGREALRQCLQNDFALILLDVNMPGMDGFETASLIRERPKSRQTPIIFVTAYDETETHVAHGYSLGAVDYIHTPVLPEVLLAKSSVFVDLALRTADIQRQAEKLEASVEERTRELQELNTILEAEIAQRELVAQDRVRLLASAEEGVRRRDDFLAILAHELRNPLSSIVSGAELLQLCELTDPTATEACDVIVRQAQHMTYLLLDLLDISRITRGKLELHPEPVDVGQAIKEAVQSKATELTQEGREIVVRLPESPLTIEADSTRLHQVLANLLGNAAKFTPARGRIEITAEREGAEAVISVRDSGVGIPQDRLGDIFEPFVQLKPSHARPSSGLGIGLTMVKNLVELHRGRVTARSDGENRGCEICVRMPLADSSGSEGPSVKLFVDRSEEPAAGARRTIVVVEDNADIRKMVVDILRKLGHEVWTASDGPAGVDAIIQKAPDLAIVDIGLPGFDGYELARLIRGNPKCNGVPLIAMTGYGQPDDHRRTADAGFARHLVKPIQLDELRDVLGEFGSRAHNVQARSAVS